MKEMILNRRNGFRLLLPMFIAFIQTGVVINQAYSMIGEETTPEQVRMEAEKLSDRIIKSWQHAGDIRKVDRDLVHPLLFENPPCPLVYYVNNNLCLTLGAEDRREYTLTAINIIWLMFEYQFSQPDLIQHLKNAVNKDPLEMFPKEVRPHIRKLTGRAETMKQFKELYSATREVEKYLLAWHSKIGDTEKANIQRNYKMIADAIPPELNRGNFEPFTAGDVTEAFYYNVPPLRFVMAKEDDAYKVLWLFVMTQ
jgi:hypothetical protein